MTRRSSGRVSKGASTSYKDDFEDSDSISVDQEDDKDSNFSLANDAPGSDWDNWDKDDDEDDEDAVDEEDQEEEEEEGAEGDDSRTSLSGAETPQDQSNKRRRISESPFQGKDFAVIIEESTTQKKKGTPSKGKQRAPSPTPSTLSVQSEAFIADDDDEEGSSKKRKRPTATTAKKAKFESKFAKGGFKKIPGLPTQIQAGDAVKAAKVKAAAGEYPPIQNLTEIFEDMVRRAPNVEPLAKTLEGRPLRIATMCSGTESPILAWRLIEKAIFKEHGIQMQHHHVFSCEIEPYKQAYIQRNFEPPLLFRDVCELGQDQAHTAFGALADVPGDVDILIAGTSCVDYSGLNNKRKGIKDGGESGRTFFGMRAWVEKHQPAVVILENVKTAPWAAVAEAFGDIGYDAAFDNSFDTKNYYIPHTRQRGYLIATRNTDDSLPQNWKNLAQSLVRPSSSPLEAFLLAVDDPRVQHVRDGFATGEGYGKGRSTTDWSRCQVRHAFARESEALGQGRPYTDWKEGGACKLPDGHWNDFFLPQPERVNDLSDVTTLRGAQKGFDPHFKCQVWELSQNVDRNIASSKPGICPCLTPSGMPFLTIRGGPMIGLEALSLQGLPVNELLLTRETNDQLQNLAGNAMSSTVVGTCMLAALIVAQKDLEAVRKDRDVVMLPSQSEVSKGIEDNIAGEEALVEQVNHLVESKPVNMQDLLKNAEASAQRCSCEGRTATTSLEIYRCKDCGHTACSKCKGKPEHDYELDQRRRIPPDEFVDAAIKDALPMRLEASELGSSIIKELGEGKPGMVKAFKAYRERVSQVLSSAEFRLSRILRQQIWLIQYEAPGATLELSLDPLNPHWRITVHSDPQEPVSSAIRPLLLRPVAMMQSDPSGEGIDLFEGEWTFCLPSEQQFEIEVKSFGPQVPSWQASLGLQGEFLDQRRFSQIEVQIPQEAQSKLTGNVSGIYNLLPKCGTPNGSLHVRADSSNSSPNDRKVFFLLDSDRFKDSKDADRFVFSTDIEKIPYPLERVTIASFKGGWRPKPCKSKEAKEVIEKTQLVINGIWVPLPSFSFSPLSKEAAQSRVAIPQKPIPIDLDVNTCKQAISVLNCSAKVPSSERENTNLWPQDGLWRQVDLVHQAKTTFDQLYWLMQRLPEVTALGDWMQATSSETHQSMSCDACAPTEPSLLWLRVQGKSPTPIENDRQAGPYEQALKNRPSPFVMQVRLDEGTSTAHVRIGVNASTLMHRALSRLPEEVNSSDAGAARPAATLSWRLSKINKAHTLHNLPKYTIKHNRDDVEAPNPKIFKLELRKEQKRSLTWMLNQEEEEVEPFEEEEVSEALLSPLGWRAEGRAVRSVVARGGILADSVGYGKTAISLGLIAASPRRGVAPSLPEASAESTQSQRITDETHLPTKATLIIVPPHLPNQWKSEVKKFTGGKFEVLVIMSKADMNKITIESILEADIVIMSVTIYKSDSYFETLARFAASNELPAKAGRFFNSSFKRSVAALKNRVRELQTEGASKVLQSIKDRVDADESMYTSVSSSKRLVGKAYQEAHADEAGDDQAESSSKKGKKKAKVEDSDDDMDVDDEDESPKKKKKTAASKPAASKGPSDPWGLGTKEVIKDFKKMKCPPLEMFYWNRVIVDEFHYIVNNGERSLPAVTSLQAQAKWVLSGTPPTADFADIKSIAVFLNIHLGVNDDQDTVKATVRRARESERTIAEKFQNFVEMRSPAWHHRRQEKAQKFLDRFVRKNVAEVGDIPYSEHICPVLLPPAERACYLELNQNLTSLETRYAGRNLYRSKGKAKTKAALKAEEKKLSTLSDRDARLRRTLGESASQDEALSRQAAHFVLQHDNEDGTDSILDALQACDFIIKERQTQRDECLSQFNRELKAAQKQHDLVLNKFFYRDDKVQALVRFSENALSAGDKVSLDALKEALERNQCMPKDLSKESASKRMGKAQTKAALDEREKQRKAEGLKTEDGENKATARAWEEEVIARNYAHSLQRLRNEYVSRECSLRFFLGVRELQKAHLSGNEENPIFCPFPTCDKGNVPLKLDQVGLSSSCGHKACWDCMKTNAMFSRCSDPECSTGVGKDQILKASDLGHEKGERKRYGIKLAQLATLMKNYIPQEERILLFVQFDGLLQKVSDALEDYGIKFLRIEGSSKKRSDELMKFQSGSERVLLLDIADESASGSNLTAANHVIFLSPLITEEAQQYEATMEQAIGRAVRFGQVKNVMIWRLMVSDTIDQKVYEEREKRILEVDQELERFQTLTELKEIEDVVEDLKVKGSKGKGKEKEKTKPKKAAKGGKGKKKDEDSEEEEGDDDDDE